MTSRQVNKRTAQILAFIKAFIDLHDYAPTRREIGDACGISSTGAVNYQLDRLQEAGYLTVDRRIARGIVINREALREPQDATTDADWKVVNEMAKVAR